MEKKCDFCMREVGEIARESYGIAHTATNVHGKVLCWQCVKAAHSQMKPRADVIEQQAQEVIKEMEAGVEDDADGCHCPACRLERRMEAFDMKCTPAEIVPASATKH